VIRIGINGLGRIGRAIFRRNLEKNFFEVVAVNDINPDTRNIAYTLQFDTLYGRLEKSVKVVNNIIQVENLSPIHVSHENNISDVDWKKYKVDYIIDASGVLANVLEAKKITSSNLVKKIFVTHSPEEVDFTMVIGANEKELDIQKHNVISTSICDATAIAPVLKEVQSMSEIESGYITTLHPWLNYQNLMDGPSSSWSVPGEIYHHYALGRSVDGNMIPKPTTAMQATSKVLNPGSVNNIGSFSYRTPTAIVGSADITLSLKSKIDKQKLTNHFVNFEKKQRNHIFQNNFEPLVSLDFLKSDYSAVIDHR